MLVDSVGQRLGKGTVEKSCACLIMPHLGGLE
jgi:hypothetical protein